MHNYTTTIDRFVLYVTPWVIILFSIFSTQMLRAQCTQQATSNLVKNGDFSQGNRNFISGYDSCSNFKSGCLWAEGVYEVGRFASFYHNDFVGFDHTTSNGNFMIINGSGALNSIVWSQKIAVKPGVKYNFSSWVSSVHPTSPAKLQFAINGVTIGSIFSAPNSINNWLRFDDEWTAGATTTIAEITILNQNNDLGGNDFGLDDITFTEVCPTQQPLLGSDVSICGLGTIDLLSNIVATATTYVRWSSLESGVWTTIKEGTGSAAPEKIDITKAGVYGVCVQDGSCFKSDSIVVTAGFKVDLGPDLIICAQSSFVLDSDRKNNYTTYKWYKNNTLISDSTRRSLVVTSPGTYRVEVYDASCGVTEADEVVVTSQSAIPTDVNFCPPTVPTFKVTPNPVGGFKWYDQLSAGNVVGKGNSITHNAIATKTLYAEDTTAFYYTLGAKTQFPSGTNNSNVANEDFIFDATESFTLKSVTVYAKVYDKDAQVKIKVTLKHSDGTPIETKDLTLKGPPIVPLDNTWPFTVPLDMAVPVGTDLRLSSVGSASQFFFSQKGTNANNVGWPSYQVPNIIKIKGLEAEKTWPRADCDCYGIFYNWEIEKGTKCARTPVTAHYYCPLPLQWLQVAATRQSNVSIVEVLWQVAHATEGNGFAVERSLDGINFERVGAQDAQALKGHYSFKDLGAEASVHYYYRIVELDIYGNRLSASKLVSIKAQEVAFNVYPNPSTGLLYLSASQGLIDKVEIYSKVGVLVASESNEPQEALVFDARGLQPDLYLIKIYTDSGIYVQTFVKE